MAGNITTFYDEAFLALNPALATVLDGKPAPVTWTFGCMLSAAGSPLYSALGTAVAQLRWVEPSIMAALALLTGTSFGRAVASCTQMPAVKWQYAQSEQLIPALVENVVGSIG